MHIKIVASSKVRDSLVNAVLEEYGKRMGPNFSIELVELGGKVEQGLKKLFSQKGPGEVIVGLDERGKAFDSVGFAGWLSEKRQRFRQLTLVIGEAEGLTETVRKEADDLISLSKMTFAYRVCLVVLVEQLYRASTIIAGHPYHK